MVQQIMVQLFHMLFTMKKMILEIVKYQTLHLHGPMACVTENIRLV